MNKSPKKFLGTYIVLEGPDYAGKGTQMTLLQEWLKNRTDKKIISVYEPGFTEAGQKLRTMVKNPAMKDSLDPLATLTLFCADRILTLREVVLPALQAGDIVISDRCFLSSIAYQGGGQGVPPEIVSQMIASAVGSVLPDLALLFQMPVEEIMKRKELAHQKRERTDDSFDSRPAEFFERVQGAYAMQIGKWPFPILPIVANRSVEEVAESIKQALFATCGDAFSAKP